MKKIISFIFILGVLGYVFAENQQQNGIQQVIYSNPISSFSDISSKRPLGGVMTIGYDLFLYQMIIGLHVQVASGTQSDIDVTSLDLIRQIKDITSVSIIESLELQVNKQEILESYLQESNRLLLQQSYILANLLEDSRMLESDLVYCSSQKSIADAGYVDALITSQGVGYLHQNLQDSLYYGRCMTEKRIMVNAKKLIIDRLVFYSDLLRRKYTYLNTHKELIVTNYVFIKDDAFDTLAGIRATLQKYNF